MTLTKPALEQLDEQPYAAIRVQVSRQEQTTVLPPLIPELLGWLKAQDIQPAGPPFLRYRLIDMLNDRLDVELGIPVATPLTGDERVHGGIVPAGIYATAIHTGHPKERREATAALLAWGEENGIAWDTRSQDSSEVWHARFEFYLNGPDDEPDMTRWKTRLAIMVADKPAQ